MASICSSTKKAVLSTAATSLLIGCVTTGVVVTQEEEFRNRVVDKQLSWPGGFEVQFLSDGMIVGMFPDGAVVGRWNWREGQFCRHIQVGSRVLPKECLTIELRDNQIRFRRADGRYFNPYNIAH